MSKKGENPGFSKARVRRVMWESVVDHVDSQSGDVNLTTLAEDAAGELGKADQGGPLDDPDHWIWEVAIEVADGYGKRQRQRTERES